MHSACKAQPASRTDVCIPDCLQELEDYAPLPDDLVGSAKRWQEWMELERPEDEPLPGDWKRMPEFERLLIFRTLRPDRLTAAMQRFVANTIGKEYTASQQYDLERSYQASIVKQIATCLVSHICKLHVL